MSIGVCDRQSPEGTEQTSKGARKASDGKPEEARGDRDKGGQVGEMSNSNYRDKNQETIKEPLRSSAAHMQQGREGEKQAEGGKAELNHGWR